MNGIPDDPYTGHEYDGIQEFDNPTPPWWTYIFWASVAWAVLYMVYYHVGVTSYSVADHYSANYARNIQTQYAAVGVLEPTRATLVRMMGEPGFLDMGQSVYRANCVTCHGPEGGGGVGPNLHDDFYKNVRQVEDFLQVITHGAANGAMPAWENRLNQNDIVLVAAYVASLRGQPVAGGAAPEGEAIAPFDLSTDSPADTTPASP